jgi:hypothetical protein
VAIAKFVTGFHFDYKWFILSETKNEKMELRKSATRIFMKQQRMWHAIGQTSPSPQRCDLLPASLYWMLGHIKNKSANFMRNNLGSQMWSIACL